MNDVSRTRRGRPPKDASDREAERRAAVSVARAILEEGGSPALTARAVADRLRISVGAIYALFESLEALKLEANALTMRALRDGLAQALAACPDGAPDERLLALASAYRRFARDHHNVWSAVFDRRTIAPPPAIAQDIASLFDLIEDVLRDVPGLDPDAVPLVAKALWSSVHGMVFLGETGSLGPVDREDVPGMIEALVRAAVRGFARPSS